MPDRLHIVVILEPIEQLAHFGHVLLVFEGDIVLRHHFDLRLNKGVSQRLERFAHRGEIVRRGVDFKGVLVRLEILGARLERLHHHGILIQFAALHDDNALFVKLPGNAVSRTQARAVLVEQVAHIRNRAVFVIGQSLDNHRDAADAVALVIIGLVVDLAVCARILIQRALDVVVWHVVGLGLGDAVAQAGVELRIGRTAFLDCNRHLTADLSEDLGFFRVIRSLTLGNIMPFGMSRHVGMSLFLS